MARLKDRYAAALFELSLESGALDDHLAQAALLRGWLERDRLAQLLESPRIPGASKHELLETLFAGQIAEELIGFLRLMVQKGREAMILPVLAAYLELGDQHRGKAAAYLASAAPLSPEQMDALDALLTEKLGRRPEISARVDPNLIGGFYIYADGYLFDRTVRTHLRNLRERLKKGGPNDHKTR